MYFEFVLTKMQTEFTNPVQYYLFSNNISLNVNQLLDKEITIEHIGYECLGCGKEKKIFRQGFCYDCFYSSPLAGDWIMKPELSTAHLDIQDRDLEYEKKVQLQPHIVYFSVSSELKVGVTRKTQVPYRWIDQGAVQALPIVEVPNRYLAGITEVVLKKHFSDKTNFRKMLQNEVPEIDLVQERQRVREYLPEEVLTYFDTNQDSLTQIEYPVLQYPAKINSLNIGVNPIYQGKLKGIKGQYLIFEDQTVFNVRTYEGFKVRLEIK
ncbi:MAG TPA: DUF2797 domain-containing protein [Flavobacterium sp.]|nr:DUF2797 domain-containing protein [Flavobacterium sp.]